MPGLRRAIPKRTSTSIATASILTSATWTNSNLQHDVWFLDAVTALNQMRAAQHARHQDVRAVAAGFGRPLAVAGLGYSRTKLGAPTS